MKTKQQGAISVLRGASIVSGLTVLSRLLGFGRDLLTARLLGAGFAADAFFVAFRIPNLLRSFVAEGALTSAFVPVFTDQLAKSQEDARRALRSTAGLLLTLTCALSLLGIVFAGDIVALFAPGFGQNNPKSDLCTALTRLMLPYIICVSLVAMLNGALNTVNIFGAAAMAQVWMNLTLIAGALLASLYNQKQAAVVLALSVLIGGIVQVVVQVPALGKAGFLLIPSRRIFTPATKHMMILILPAILGAAVYQLQIFANTVLASLLEDGSISWLFYADRLVQLPIGIFSIALASVLLPALSRAASQHEERFFSSTLSDALRFTSFVILPVAAVFFIFAEPLIGLAFERGAFTRATTIQTAQAVRAYSLGLWAVSCHSMLVRALIAKKDTVTPTIVGAIALLITIALSLLFMGRPAAGTPGVLYQAVVYAQNFLLALAPGLSLGHGGLALASSCSAFAAIGMLIALVARRSSITWGPFVLATLKSLTASTLMVIVCQAVPQGSGSYGLRLVLGLPLAAAVFVAASWALGSKEFSQCLDKVPAIWRKRSSK